MYALARADRDGARPRLLGRNSRVREEWYYILLVVVVRGVFGLGAAAARAAHEPAAISVCILQGRFEGVMVEERGEGVLVEAEAARHVSYVASWAPKRACSAVDNQGPSS